MEDLTWHLYSEHMYSWGDRLLMLQYSIEWRAIILEENNIIMLLKSIAKFTKSKWHLS